VPAAPLVPALVAAAGERASLRFLEFLAADIRNPHTRRAYYRAAEEFLAWCAEAGVPSLAAVQPVHVATWIEASMRELAAPSVKQWLTAIRHLFNWLVTGLIGSNVMRSFDLRSPLYRGQSSMPNHTPRARRERQA
jgi:site-specific recombinase XerD